MSLPLDKASIAPNSPEPPAPLAAFSMSTISGDNKPVAAALAAFAAASAAAWAPKRSPLAIAASPAASPAALAAASTASVPSPNKPA